MNKKKIQEKYNKGIKLIEKYNKFYYINSKPLVSDQEYDNLKKQIIELEEKNQFLNSSKSPLKVVGYKPSRVFKKVPHRAPMLSLSNAFDREDLINFEKIINFLSKNKNFKIFIVLNLKLMEFQHL